MCGNNVIFFIDNTSLSISIIHIMKWLDGIQFSLWVKDTVDTAAVLISVISDLMEYTASRTESTLILPVTNTVHICMNINL